MVDALIKNLQEEQQRVAEDVAILANAKNADIAKSHQLAKEQQKVYTANQRNTAPTSVASAVGRPGPLSSGIERLRQKFHDSKRRSNPSNCGRNPCGFSGVRPITGSATSLSPNYIASSSTVTSLPEGSAPSQLTVIADSTGGSEASQPPTATSPSITSTSPCTPASVLGSDGKKKLRERFEL
jgi:hypothetical protein